jgi:hypothetical protein
MTGRVAWAVVSPNAVVAGHARSFSSRCVQRGDGECQHQAGRGQPVGAVQ